jgi:hypothetical protein
LITALTVRRVASAGGVAIDQNTATGLRSGWSWGCVSAIDSNGRTIFIADAYRDGGKRLVVHADEKLTAFAALIQTGKRSPSSAELDLVEWLKTEVLHEVVWAVAKGKQNFSTRCFEKSLANR